MCGMGPVVNKSLVDQVRTEQVAGQSTTASAVLLVSFLVLSILVSIVFNCI